MFPGDIGTKTSKCKRCGMIYPSHLRACYHCSNLTEGEAKNYKAEYFKQKYSTNASLGRMFIYVAIIIAVILIWAN